jgi:hypothetical protein
MKIWTGEIRFEDEANANAMDHALGATGTVVA